MEYTLAGLGGERPPTAHLSLNTDKRCVCLRAVVPDLQGITGWYASASLRCGPGNAHYPVLLHFGTGTPTGAAAGPDSEHSAADAAAAFAGGQTEDYAIAVGAGGPGPQEPAATVSLQQFLRELSLFAQPSNPHGSGTSGDSSARPIRQTAHTAASCSARRTTSGPAHQGPDTSAHPNIAILVNPFTSCTPLPACSPSSSLPHDITAAAHISPSSPTAAVPAPLDTAPSPAVSHTQPRPRPLPASSLGVCWRPGLSLADCLRQPHIASTAVGSAAGAGGGGAAAAAGWGPHPAPGPAATGAASTSSRLADTQIRFLLLQLVAAVCNTHTLQGRPVGGISPTSMLLRPGGWLQLLPASPAPQPAPPAEFTPDPNDPDGESQPPAPEPPPECTPPAHSLPLPLRLPPLPCAPASLPALTRAWQRRVLTNLDYLLLLNLAAGRRLGDRTLHPFVPWVTDFSVHPEIMLRSACTPHRRQQHQAPHPSQYPQYQSQGHTELQQQQRVGQGGGAVAGSGGSGGGGWHCLTQSRYRQAKGDLQLDVTYDTAEPPHHIPHVRRAYGGFCRGHMGGVSGPCSSVALWGSAMRRT